MKKKLLALCLCVSFGLSICACGGSVENVTIVNCESQMYTEKDISDAISVVEKYFSSEFGGCSLTQIGYVGDEDSQEFVDEATEHGADEVIVLMSEFYVSSDCKDSSLMEDSTYDGWRWVLVRKKGGKWILVNQGYC